MSDTGAGSPPTETPEPPDQIYPCIRCQRPMPDDGSGAAQCYGGICHDCAGCADPYRGMDETNAISIDLSADGIAIRPFERPDNKDPDGGA